MKEYFNEKEIVDLDALRAVGVNLCSRDVSKEYDEKIKKTIYKINFTGFEVNNKGNR